MDAILDILFAPMRLFIRAPIFAFVPAAILLVCALLPRAAAPRIVLWAGIAWALYAAWEVAIFYWSRSQPPGGGAPIRADLLLIAPALYILTIVALVLWWRHAFR